MLRRKNILSAPVVDASKGKACHWEERFLGMVDVIKRALLQRATAEVGAVDNERGRDGGGEREQGSEEAIQGEMPRFLDHDHYAAPTMRPTHPHTHHPQWSSL